MAIKQLPEVQQRRIKKYYFEEKKRIWDSRGRRYNTTSN